MFFEYTKNKYTPKVTMDIYQTQVEKYINIVDDLKKNYEENNSNKAEKIDMEDELNQYIDQHMDSLRL
jgi:hypothetical protein